jgi:hypothetical protein
VSTLVILPDAELDDVGFDATLMEDSVLPAAVSANPVERGAPVTDDIRVDPIQISAEVLVTETPSDSNFYGDGQRGIVSIPVKGRGTLQVLAPRVSGAPQRSLVTEMHERLDRLRRERTTCTVITSTLEFPSMVLASVQLNRPPNSGGKGIFRLSFVEIKTATTSVISAPRPAEPRAQSKKVQGKAPASDPKKDGTPVPAQEALISDAKAAANKAIAAGKAFLGL